LEIEKAANNQEQIARRLMYANLAIRDLRAAFRYVKFAERGCPMADFRRAAQVERSLRRYRNFVSKNTHFVTPPAVTPWSGIPALSLTTPGMDIVHGKSPFSEFSVWTWLIDQK
jgi:hypothetical protein